MYNIFINIGNTDNKQLKLFRRINMSAFLGPIHYWLYNKIQVQQQLINGIIALSQKVDGLDINLKQELDTKYGVSETRALEEVIDEGNIHGWLQTQVSQVEYKLAYSVTKLLEKNTALFKDLELLFETKGNENALSESTNNVSAVYKSLTDLLLDGMPCDHANVVLEENSDKVVWERNTCVHKDYWEAVGGDIRYYYTLREAFIKGFLKNTSITFEKIDEITSML
jgi:hypothetical protein